MPVLTYKVQSADLWMSSTTHAKHIFMVTIHTSLRLLKNYVLQEANMLRKKKPAASNNKEKTLVNDTGKLSPIRVHHAFQTKSSTFPDRFTNTNAP
jgi:hypothetical protein